MNRTRDFEALTGSLAENFFFGDVERTPDAEDSLPGQGIVDSTGTLELVGFLAEPFGIEVAASETVPRSLDGVANLIYYLLGKSTLSPQAIGVSE